LYFSVQELSTDNIALLDITSPPKHQERTKLYMKQTSTLPLSFVVPVCTSQSSEDDLPFNDVTPIPILFYSSYDIHF